MRIIHTDTDDIENPLRGGQPVRTFEVNSRLSSTHQIKVFTATYKDCANSVVRNNIDYERLGLTIPGWGLSSHLSFLARLPAAIKRTPHDLVVEEFTPPFGFCGLQKVTDKPVVSIVQWFFFNDWQKRYKLPFENIMRKRALHFPHRHIIVQTNKMGAYFKDLLPQADIYKVPCGINNDAFDDADVVGEYALYLGRLDTQHKGLDDLLQSWALLKEQGLSIPLWIVGAGKDEASLKALTQSLNLTNEVHFKGRLEGQEKKVALKNCRFLVMPSRQETFGLTALEAMAVKKPVIAYDIDHLNELLMPTWSVNVPLGNVGAFAKAVAAFWQNPAQCVQFGQRAYEEARKYCWDEIALKQQDIYLNIMKKSA
jgi:glycogen(starch) synthase